MSIARVQNFSISLDGFGTGEGQSADAHFGHAGDRLHEWMFTTRYWRPGGTGGGGDRVAAPFQWGGGGGVMGGGEVRHPRRAQGPGCQGGGGWGRCGGREVRPPRAGGGPGRGGAGGPPPRRFTHRSSCSRITRARRSRWRVARRSTSSTRRPPRRSRQPVRPPTARTY